MEEFRKGILWPLIVAFIAVIVFGYYGIRYLDKIEIGYIIDKSFFVQTGSKILMPDIRDLVVNIDQIKYQNKGYDSLRILSYRVINNTAKQLKEKAVFFLQEENDRKIPAGAVIGMVFKREISTGEMVVVKQRAFDDTYGHSFEIQSSLPGKSSIVANIIINQDSLCDIDHNGIDLKKVPRAQEHWTKLFSPKNKVTFTYMQLIFVILICSWAYAITWFAVNVVRNRYSTGMEIVDNVWRKFFNRKFFKKA